MSKVQHYEGKEIDVNFDAEKCIHSRRCIVGQPNVFEANAKGPWIHPDMATPDQIVKVSEKCPSGAITYSRHNGGQNETAPAANIAYVWENGPLAFHADLHIQNQPPRYRATLCRCGASKSKPFCDSSHKGSGFLATGEPKVQKSIPLAQKNGPVTIAPIKDGPLMVTGNLELCCRNGKTVCKNKEMALCRCGNSQNKPFCDGSHKTTGFKT